MARYTSHTDPLKERVFVMPEFKKAFQNRRRFVRLMFLEWCRNAVTKPLFILQNPENKSEKVYFDYFIKKVVRITP